MNKVVIGILFGLVLGALDGATAWFTPAARAGIVGILIGSSIKGMLVGSPRVLRTEGELHRQGHCFCRRDWSGSRRDHSSDTGIQTATTTGSKSCFQVLSRAP